MNRRHFAYLMFGSLAWQLLPGCTRNPGSRPVAGAPAATRDPAPVPPLNNAAAAYKTENQAQVELAIQRQEQEQRMARAVAQTGNYRGMLQLTTEGEWSSFINAHRQTFLELRRQAARLPAGSVSCTVCGGRGVLDFCIVCHDTGKCPTCKGTGALMDGSPCPTCQANGKCFLCHSSGKMPCPFCDDGLVYARQPSPPGQIPISV